MHSPSNTPSPKIVAALAAALCLFAWPVLAADGILIVEKSTTNGMTRTNQIQIEKTRMRAENDRNGRPQIIVFDGNAQLLRIINPDAKTYSETTKADVERLGGQLQAAMAQLQDRLKNMPEAQRAQMEAMMRGRGLPGLTPPPKPEYRKTGTDKVANWTCDKYEEYENNQKVSELCTVDPKVIGVLLADFDVTKQLADFFQQLSPQNPPRLFTVGQAERDGYSGVPVRRIYYSNGTVQSTSELSSVSRQSFPDALYAVPAGFQKEDNPFQAAGRGLGR